MCSSMSGTSAVTSPRTMYSDARRAGRAFALTAKLNGYCPEDYARDCQYEADWLCPPDPRMAPTLARPLRHRGRSHIADDPGTRLAPAELNRGRRHQSHRTMAIAHFVRPDTTASFQSDQPPPAVPQEEGMPANTAACDEVSDGASRNTNGSHRVVLEGRVLSSVRCGCERCEAISSLPPRGSREATIR